MDDRQDGQNTTDKKAVPVHFVNREDLRRDEQAWTDAASGQRDGPYPGESSFSDLATCILFTLTVNLLQDPVIFFRPGSGHHSGRGFRATWRPQRWRTGKLFRPENDFHLAAVFKAGVSLKLDRVPVNYATQYLSHASPHIASAKSSLFYVGNCVSPIRALTGPWHKLQIWQSTLRRDTIGLS